MADRTGTTETTTVLYVIVVVVAVLIGTVLAPVVWGLTQQSADDDPDVSVVTLRGGTSASNINQVTEELRQARTNDSTEAVVLRVDSPGGAVASSEEFFLAVNRTASEMPVVSYVEGTAASGGYFGIAPSDAIYVKPSSVVGSIGVTVSAPLSTVEQEERVSKSYLRTGPDKATITKDSIRSEMETLQNAFLNVVMEHRGANLSLDRTEVARGDTYLGPEAVQNGFADEIGSLSSAVEHAAGAADGIEEDNYDVVYHEPVEASSGLVLASEDVERVDGDIVYVDAAEADSEFTEPVEYYAVWGVPTGDTTGVSPNETG